MLSVCVQRKALRHTQHKLKNADLDLANLFFYCKRRSQDKRKKYPGLSIPNNIRSRTFEENDSNDLKIAQDALAELEALAPSEEIKIEQKGYVCKLIAFVSTVLYCKKYTHIKHVRYSY